MKTIWKFPLDITDVQEIEMPRGAVLLSVAMQQMSVGGDGGLMLWVLVNPDAPRVTRHVQIFGTGNAISDHPGHPGQFIGTVQMAGGALVWHVFVAPEVVGL